VCPRADRPGRRAAQGPSRSRPSCRPSASSPAARRAAAAAAAVVASFGERTRRGESTGWPAKGALGRLPGRGGAPRGYRRPAGPRGYRTAQVAWVWEVGVGNVPRTWPAAPGRVCLARRDWPADDGGPQKRGASAPPCARLRVRPSRRAGSPRTPTSPPPSRASLAEARPCPALVMSAGGVAIRCHAARATAGTRTAVQLCGVWSLTQSMHLRSHGRDMESVGDSEFPACGTGKADPISSGY
jgi:hypothetical protein